MSSRAHAMLAVLVVLALVFIVRLVRRRHLKAKYSLLWLSIGGVLAVFAAVPGLLDWTAERLGIYYQPTLFILLALLLLLLIVMHFSYELTRLEDRVRTLAEEAALVRRRLDALERDGSTTGPADGDDGEATGPGSSAEEGEPPGGGRRASMP